MTLWRTPRFWYDPKVPCARTLRMVLSPLSVLYDLGRRIARRAAPQPKRAACPVLCVGNLTAGGSGKTPTVLALARLLHESGLRHAPAFVTRGYGGNRRGPVRVDPAQHTAYDVGDEALLLARQAPTFVARDRPAGASLATQSGADVILLDDGLQNLRLVQDLRFVVIDAQVGFGNGALLPAGPLREPLAEGFSRADAFILIGEDRWTVRALLTPEKPVFTAQLDARSVPDPSRRWVAFAGLGRPEKFLHTLRDLGIEPVQWIAFPDHHPYGAKDLAVLTAQAREHGAGLLTTEKDALRLPPDFAAQVETLPVVLTFSDPKGLTAFLKARLSACGDRA